MQSAEGRSARRLAGAFALALAMALHSPLVGRADCTPEVGLRGSPDIEREIALLRNQGDTGSVSLRTLGLFRMRTGDGASDFTFNRGS